MTLPAKNHDQIQTAIEAARLKYKPATINTLIIAEAPPDNLERFFYYESVRKADYLFLGIVSVLYPTLKDEYLASKRSTELKRQILHRLQSDGFYLIDLSDEPLSYASVPLHQNISTLVKKVHTLIDLSTRIILVKANVHEYLYEPLKNAGFIDVNKNKMPFPSQGWQGEFKKQFQSAVEKSKTRV